MSLPELEWQFVYGRLAWAVVAATLLAALLPAAWRRSRAFTGSLLLGSVVLMALPGELSAAYWLKLAFQWPSGLLVGCCLLRLGVLTSVRATPMPAGLALALALAGAALYLDAIGVLALGLYYWGFSPLGAPLLALAAGAGLALCAAAGRACQQALVLLGALALFSLFRLPTGNLWDALLDPLLWGWAVCALAARGWAVLAGALRRARGSIEPATASAAAPILPSEGTR